MGKNCLKMLAWLRGASVTLPGVLIIALSALIAIAFRPPIVVSQSQDTNRSGYTNLDLDLTPRTFPTASDRPAFAPGEILIKYKKLNRLSSSSDMAEQVSPLESKFQLKEITINHQLEIHTYQLPEGRDVLETATILGTDPAVEFAEPNYYRYLAVIPNDPAYSNYQVID